MFSFTKNRFRFYTVALALSIISLAAPFVLGINLGIDMTGGIQIEYTVTKGDEQIAEKNADTIAEKLKKEALFNGKEVMNDINVYGIAGTTSFIVEAGFSTPEDATTVDIEKLKTEFVTKLSTELSKDTTNTVEQSRYVNIGESFGAYIKKSAYWTLALAVLVISFYIQYAFRGSIQGMASWPFAAVTAVSLVHDVLVAFGLYVITSYFFPQFKIDTFLLTAMLTIL